MKTRPFSKFASTAPASRLSTLAFCATLLAAGPLFAVDLLSWDVTGSTGVTGSGVATPGALGVTGTELTAGGLTGNGGSPANTWNRSYLRQTDFAAAITAGNFISFSTSVDAGFTATIDGISGLNLARTSVGPDMAGLFYSTNGGTTFTQTGNTFTLLNNNLQSAATAFSATLAATPLVVAGPATIQWRVVFYSDLTTGDNRAGVGNASTNDFAITGTVSSATVKNLLWNGSDGDPWNYTAIKWLNTDNGNAPVAFSANDRATISTAGKIVVDAGGVSIASATVNHPSGTVTLSGGSLTGISLTKNGAGTLRLESVNTFTGGANLNGGITEVAITGALGTQKIALAGATLSVAPAVTALSAPIELGIGGGAIDNSAFLTLPTVANTIANNPFTKTGAGELELANGLGTQSSGAVNLSVAAGSVTVSGTGTAKQINLGALVNLTGNLNVNGPNVVFHASEVTGTGTIVVRDAGSNLNTRFNAGTINVRVPVKLEADGSVESANGTNALNFFGDISGPFNLLKKGNGLVTFRTDMSYTGTTTLNDKGTLRLNGTGNLGQGDVIIANVDARLSFEVSGEITVSNNISGVGAVTNAVTSQAPVNLTGILSYGGQTVIGSRILRFDGASPDLLGGVLVQATLDAATTGAIGGNGSIGGGVTINAGGGISTRIRDWTGAAGVGYDDLAVDFVDIQGALVVKVDGKDLVNFTESAKSFTILNAVSSISGFDPAMVSFVKTNFPGNGTFSLAQSGTSLVLSYAAGSADPYLAFVSGSPYNLAGSAALPKSDPDNDGIPNAVEFVIGGNPASAPDLGKLPTFTTGTASDPFIFRFRRTSASAYLNPSVEYSSTLAGWTKAVNGTDGVVITVNSGIEAGVDEVVVSIPKTLASGSKLFARLNVVIP